MDKAIVELSKFEDITCIAAEEALQKFSGGNTTANTMNKLIAMNFGLTYSLSRLWDIEIEYITKSSNGIVDTTTIDIGHFERGHNMRFIDNEYVYTNKFYFEFEFDSLPGAGLCYDYYWGTSFFEICYYDFRNDWINCRQIRTTIH